GKFRNEEALVEFEAAMKLARLPHERALALDGLATICFRNKENERALELWDQAIIACQPGGKTPIDGETASALANAWFEKGVALTTMSRDEEAIETFDQALDRYLDRVTAVDLPSGDWRRLRRCMVRALNLKGSVLSSLERVSEGLECCEEAI